MGLVYIFLRFRRTKKDHHLIADKFVDGPLVRNSDRGHFPQEFVNEHGEDGRVEPAG